MFDMKKFDLKALAEANPFVNVDKLLADTEKFITADMEAMSAANQKLMDNAVKAGELASAYVKELTEARTAFVQSAASLTSPQAFVEAGKAHMEAEQKKGAEFVETLSGMSKELSESVAADLKPRFEARVEVAKTAFEKGAVEAPVAAPAKKAPAKAAA